MIEVHYQPHRLKGMLRVDDEYVGPGWLTPSPFNDNIVCEYCGLSIPGAVAGAQMVRAREHREACPSDA